MGEIRTIPPRATKTEWNALLDHSLEKTASYIVRSGSASGLYESINGSTGVISYSGSDAALVLRNSFSQLSAGGSVFLKKGTYVLTSKTAITGRTYSGSIILTDNQALIGECKSGSILKLGSAVGGNVVVIENGSTIYDIQIANLTINGTSGSQTDSGLDGDLCGIRGYIFQRSNIQNVHIYGCMREGLYVSDCQWNHYEDIQCDNCGGEGFNWDSEALSDGVNIRAYNNAKRGLYIVGGASQEAAWVTLLGGEASNNVQGGLTIYNAIGVSIYGFKAHRNGAVSSWYDGIYINNSTDIYLSDCQAYENYRAGFLGNASSRVTINGGCSYNNRYDGIDLAGDGMYLDGCQYWRVFGWDAFDSRTTKSQIYGIHSVTTSDYNTFIACDVRDNGSGTFSLSGSNNYLYRNRGYVTQNEGTLTLSSQSGSVAHDLASTPSRVQLTASGSSGNLYLGALTWYPSGSAGVYVVQTGSGTVAVNWRAEF